MGLAVQRSYFFSKPYPALYDGNGLFPVPGFDDGRAFPEWIVRFPVVNALVFYFPVHHGFSTLFQVHPRTAGMEPKRQALTGLPAVTI